MKPNEITVGMAVYYYPSNFAGSDSPKFLGYVASKPWLLGDEVTGSWVCCLKGMERGYGEYTCTGRDYVKAASLNHLEPALCFGGEEGLSVADRVLMYG